MSVDRRTVLAGLGAAAALSAARLSSQSAPVGATVKPAKSYDVAIAGAGCFGAWIAWHLARAGRSVLLVDPYGPANARASSGGESRVIRMSYGSDEIYSRFSFRSLALWKELFARVGRPELFSPSGVLWLARPGNASAEASLVTLTRLGIPHQRLSTADLERRFPQMRSEPGGWGIWEPDSGVLLARRAVAAVVADARAAGVDFVQSPAAAPAAVPETKRRAQLKLANGDVVAAGVCVYACGPWLGKVVPDVLGERIFPTRQEVLFFGTAPGETRFDPGALPAWIDFGQQWYGIPNLESRGFKLADDAHGEPVDPDTLERIISPATVERARAFLKQRFPSLAKAPLVESRVCQYENTSSGDFVLDRHPAFDNVWLAGGGSGHGFKHGPAVGEHVAGLVLGNGTRDPDVDLRFSLATKAKSQNRAVQ